MTERRLPKTAVENLVEDLASKANADLSNLDATGQAKFDEKANIDLSNLSAIGNDKFVTKDTAQTISGEKIFTSGKLRALRPIFLKENDADEGGQISLERSGNSVLKNNPYIDLWVNTIRFVGKNSNDTVNIPLEVNLENNKVSVPTPAVASNNTQVATTAWFNSKMQVVSALPANPDPNVFYFIPE